MVIHVLIATEDAGALAEVVDRAYGKAISFTPRRAKDAAPMCLGHTALSDQDGIAPSVLGAGVPEVTIRTQVHCRITLSRVTRIQRVCNQGSGTATGRVSQGVIHVLILARKLEVFPGPRTTHTPHFFGF